MKRQTKVITEGTTKKYLIGLSTMTVALLFFLFSGFVFGDQNQAKVQQTPLDEPLNLRGAGNLVIEDWIYNPSTNLMIVTLNIDKSTTNFNDSLTFVAQEREHPERKLLTTVEYHDESSYVISIQQVSPSFDVMALDINKKERDDLSLEKEQTSPKGGKEKDELARIYTDQRKVKIDKTLSIQTEQEYELSAVHQDIKKAKETMKEKEKQMQSIDDRLKEMDQKKVELESERLYETEEEKKQTDTQIHQIENEKERLNRKATEYETTIQTMREKLKMLKEKRNMISS